ncbi:MAG TPA: ABC transporter permease [Gemmatimonadales bacterium]
MLHDVRVALRRLTKAPGFTVAAVLCLALGIGANTAIFTVINAVLLRPLPYAEPERLVAVWEARTDGESERNSVSPANYLDWARENRVFGSMAAVWDVSLSLADGGEPEQVPAQLATSTLLPLLGVEPLLGRTFTAEEEAAGARVAVLTHGLWVERYGSDPAVVGRTIRLNGAPYTVLGVMPPVTEVMHRRVAPRLWAPLGLDPAHDYRVTGGRYLYSVARLRPGITLDAARAEMVTLARRLAETYPYNLGWTVNLVPLTEQLVGAVQRPLAVLGGVVLLVLLIACANVANLQLTQATVRRREIALRTALGATGARVTRQFLTESVLIALAGGALGVLLAMWGTAGLMAAASVSLPRVNEIGLDWRVLGFTLAVSVAAGIGFGVVPALHALRGPVHEDLKEGGRGTEGRGRRTRGLLVMGQVAVAVVLLVGAGLLLRSFARLQDVNLGLDPEGLLTARFTLGSERYDDPARQTAFFQELLARAAAIPGVRSAGAINWLPLSGDRSATDILIAGEPLPAPGEILGTDVRAVDPGFFATMRIPLRQGRTHTAADGAHAPRTIVVSESFVARYLAGRDPIGRQVIMEWGDTLVGTVVGVVGDVRHTGLDSLPEPTIYWALPQFPSNFMTVVLRTDGDPMALAGPLRAAVRAIDPAQPVADVRSFDDYLGLAVARRRLTLMLLGGFAGLALTLTAIGLYGTTAYGVAQRTRELGIRVALGAQRSEVLWAVLRGSLGVVASGLAVGIVAALALSRVLASQLYEVNATDPLVYAGIALVLALVGALSSYLPARRATRVDPIVAIRAE